MLTRCVGGGKDHGLVALYVLRSVMADLNAERTKAGLPYVRAWEVFDLIAGTGIGG
jgi:predicted AAA+ superfamily ATPase